MTKKPDKNGTKGNSPANKGTPYMVLTSVLSFRGLYIGYLKLRTFVDAIHVVVQENCPNVLPHVKLRDNPNVSR